MPKEDITPHPTEISSADKRGRQANMPPEISWRGWWDIARRVISNVNRHDISLLAAGVALFMMLSIFPALNVGVSLYGLFLHLKISFPMLNHFGNCYPNRHLRYLPISLPSSLIPVEQPST